MTLSSSDSISSESYGRSGVGERALCGALLAAGGGARPRALGAPAGADREPNVWPPVPQFVFELGSSLPLPFDEEPDSVCPVVRPLSVAPDPSNA